MNDAVARSVARIRRRPRLPAAIAIVLGSGWHGVADRVQGGVDIAYGDLPAFPVVGVAGHAGTLRLGRIGGVEVAVLSGRQHTYETGQADAMNGAIRTLAQWGVRALLLTNASGSLDAAMRPGSMMVLSDHLNMAQRTPLHGEAGAERFVDLRDAYDPALRAVARRIAAERGDDAARGRLRLDARPAVRDAGRDPHAAPARGPCRGHEHGARDHRGAPCRPARAGAGDVHQHGLRPRTKSRCRTPTPWQWRSRRARARCSSSKPCCRRWRRRFEA